LTLDDNLFHFWDASLTGDPIRRFLYNYQILEYAAFYHIDDDVKRAIRKVLISPSAVSNLEKSMREIIEAIGGLKMQED
jgi:hypothetical protein